ncbi:hypothetical protein [Micromonospora robiginosa]|uniref:Uncharacterized protein n=1 Tax=Micromonospora robiginosa TaxID=2749844 RepID=A0A7L6B2N6_9ACTN|nr:hypothetical protein [Micromonospora ferruginea]QLQ36243.1 hypothetical protein H1D33_23395 [Micromonospora ferruginea]
MWFLALWRRLLVLLQGPEPVAAPISSAPPPPPPGRLTERREISTPIVVPARGYVFTFRIRAMFVWSSNGIPREMLSGSAQYFMPYAVRALTNLAAARARNFAAHRARDLEVELQRELAATGPWRYERGGAEVACKPYVWVELDEGVKQAVRPYWEQLIKLDCEYDVDVKRAQNADRLSRQWLSILGKLVDNPAAGGAAKMTDENFAAVVQELIAQQQAATQRLNDLIEDGLRSDDEYERKTSFDLLAERLKSHGRAASAEPREPSRNGASPRPGD